MLTAPGLSRSDLHWAYVYRVLGWINDFQQSGSILRQRQQVCWKLRKIAQENDRGSGLRIRC